MITRIVVSTHYPAQRDLWAGQARTLGLADFEVRRAYFFETCDPIPPDRLSRLAGCLADPVLQKSSCEIQPEESNEVWVAYKRGIVDNESDSLLQLCRFLDITADASKVASVYVSTDPRLAQVVNSRFFNPNIEEMHLREPVYETLQPIGHYAPMDVYDLRPLTESQLRDLGRANGRNLTLDQMRKVQGIQIATGAPHVTDVLLEALDARWSDHCSHTTWKGLGNLLRRLVNGSRDTNNPNILSMFVDNAGVWDFYDGVAIAFKGETHNGPSAISAYFGQLTKLGGVLRDILGAGLGADPIGTFEYTATGVPGTPSPLPGRPDPHQIATETIRAIKEYGNTLGVPMMWSRMCFHPSYRAKPFALGGSIGVIPVDVSQKGSPEAGDLLFLIGGLTGNDGIHGASASSAGSDMDQAAVQIGSPLEEVKFNTAILELRDSGCIRAITDVGGAGLNSAVGEIGDPCGVWLNTALVPLKTAGLPMASILLSESQERMVLAVKSSHVETSREILRKHQVRTAIVGKFTGLGRYTVVFDRGVTEEQVIRAVSDSMPSSGTGEVGIDVPYDLLDYDPPAIPVPTAPLEIDSVSGWPKLCIDDLAQLLPQLMCDIEVCDQSMADSQYDSTVQGRQTYGPYSGSERKIPTSFWASRLIPDKPYAALFAAAFDPWLFEIHPRLATRQCFLALLQKLVLAGSKVRDIAVCDNFYTPHLSSDGHYWLVEMVDELADLVRRFGSPVISGKDSSAGSVQTPEGLIHVPPAVFFSGIAKAPEFQKLLHNDLRRAGNLLVQIGPASPSPAATVAGRTLILAPSKLDEIDLDAYGVYLRALESADRGQWASGIPIGAGGILATLIRASVATGLGVELDSPPEGLWWLIAEHRCGAIIEIGPDALSSLPEKLQPRPLGRITAGPSSLRVSGTELLSAGVEAAWTSSFGETLK